MAFDSLTEQVLANQSTSVDVLTSASVSSCALLNALDKCAQAEPLFEMVENAGGYRLFLAGSMAPTKAVM